MRHLRLPAALLLVLLLGVPLQAAVATVVAPPGGSSNAVPAAAPEVPGLPGPAGRAPRPIEARARTIEVPPGDFAAYATGTILHADAVTPTDGDTSLLGVDVAFSGSAFSSVAPTDRYANEMGRFVVPDLPADGGHGRGDGLELGIAAPPTPLIGELAEASAPPSTDMIEKVIDLDASPLVEAELLRGRAQARSAGDGCVLGSNLGYGLGSVLNLRLLDGLVSTSAIPPLREVAQSSSRTRIVPTDGGRLGLMSETRQTIAPVTLFEGTDAQFTIEVLGEWVLRAVADGTTASIHYGPNETSPETPILRVLDAEGDAIDSITFQDFLGDEGLVIEVPGVATVALGEDPRAIDGDAATPPVQQPTQALAAVDVVRVQLLDGALADVRIGHMEAAVAVPAEGVVCPGITVDHTVDPELVTPDEEFTYTIEVTNPNDCVLSAVTVTETITAPAGVTFEIVSGGDSRTDTTVTWENIGPLAAGETVTLTVVGRASPGSLPGALTSEAVASGVCDAPAEGPDAGEDIPVEGMDTVDGPEVAGPCVVPDLDGRTLEEAKTALEEAGCELGDVTQDPAADPADLGKVTDQTPDPDTTHPPGTEVDVVIGGPVCAVPDLEGLTEAEAAEALEEAGCELGDVIEGDTGPDPGRVTDQNPDGGTTAPPDTEVHVTVSGPLCHIGDLTGLDEDTARAQVEAEGCELSVTTGPVDDPAEIRTVVDQDPAPGTTLPPGSTVEVVVGAPEVLGVQLEAEDPDVDGAGVGALPRTGGVAVTGLALLLLSSGLSLRLAGARRRRNVAGG